MLFVADASARVLGPMKVSTNGRDIDLGAPRQRAVFAVLAAHTNQVVSRDELIDAVWGADPPPTAINSIYTYIARLRNLIEPARLHRAPSNLLVSDASGYTLLLPPDRIDKQQFVSHLDNARRLHASSALHSAVGELEAALALWQGQPYGGAVGHFVEVERTHLAELRRAAIEQRAEILLELGRHDDAAGELFRLARDNPLRERLAYLLMQCYLGQGRQADALTHYHELRTALADQLGIEPGADVQRLYRLILRRDPAQPPEDARPLARQAVELRPAAVPAQLGRDVPDFTGRTAELGLLHDQVNDAAHASGSAVVVITGGPGVGKSALAVRFAHERARHCPDGQLHIDLRGFAASGEPTPHTTALGQLITALGGSAHAPDSLDRRAGLYRSLVAGRRMIILLDNAASVDQVRPLIPGASSCVVIITSRSSMAGLTARDGARRVTLDAMPENDAIRLFYRVSRRIVATGSYPAVRRLVLECGRLPLAVRIMAERINAAPSPERAIAAFDERFPLDYFDVPGDEQTSLRSVFEWSYRRLPDDVAGMFHALGRHGGPVLTIADAAALAGTEPPVTRRLLDALIDASLVQEPAPDRFQMNPLMFAYARQLHAVGR
jgi:DNA-binding SARP family transcriptional activator